MLTYIARRLLLMIPTMLGMTVVVFFILWLSGGGIGGAISGVGVVSNAGDASLTVFDVASLTKVVSTTAAAMLLYQRGLLDLETPLGELLPGLIDKLHVLGR